MNQNPNLTLLIPTYNEAEIIESALRDIAKELGPEFSSQTEIIITDDGTDSLPQIVEAVTPTLPFYAVKVIRNSPPLGKGRSLTEGFLKASAEITGFMDVDLSTPPRYIKGAFEKVASRQADIVIGSRKAAGAKVARDQIFLKDIFGKLLSIFARNVLFRGMRFYEDTQCGFKFYKTRQARMLYSDLLAADGLNDLEVLIRANFLGLTVHEVGVEWTDLRESKRTLRRILWGEVKAIMNILWHYRLFSGKKIRELKKKDAHVNHSMA